MVRRWVQGLCMAVFAGLFGAVVLSGADTTVFEWVLGLDPALSGVTALAGRALMWAFLPAALLLVAAFLVGRAFCGWICPMGTLIDLLDGLAARRKRKPQPDVARRWQRANFWVLGLLLGAAVLGFSLVYVASPLSLMTRIIGVGLYPILVAGAELGLWAARPVAETAGLYGLVFAEATVPRFDTRLFILLFVGALLAVAWVAPRFWCRFACPAGALLAVPSFKPLIRRRVGEACGGCARCADVCPMGAIDTDDFRQTRHADCILCKSCQTVCSKAAVSFLPPSVKIPAPESPAPDPLSAAARRKFVLGGLAGAGTAAVSLSGLIGPALGGSAGQAQTADAVRPPGTLPEDQFLARCVRCAACVVICPENALQPLYDNTGIGGLFSPALVPAGGPCDPTCARCGEVCPTGAIRQLAGGERLWAKTGTAEIVREDCLAWEDKEKCMVCDEVCPFDAVVFKFEPGHSVTVPFVEEAKCSGCGYCEHECPIKRPAAIIVRPKDALRLTDGSYEQAGRAHGFDITLDVIKKPGAAPAAYPSLSDQPGGGGETYAPGFDTESPAPGFDPG